MRLRCPLSTEAPKHGEGMEAQTCPSDLSLERCARHRYFDFDEALFNERSFGVFFKAMLCFADLSFISSTEQKPEEMRCVCTLEIPKLVIQPPFSDRLGCCSCGGAGDGRVGAQVWSVRCGDWPCATSLLVQLIHSCCLQAAEHVQVAAPWPVLTSR